MIRVLYAPAVDYVLLPTLLAYAAPLCTLYQVRSYSSTCILPRSWANSRQATSLGIFTASLQVRVLAFIIIFMISHHKKNTSIFLHHTPGIYIIPGTHIYMYHFIHSSKRPSIFHPKYSEQPTIHSFSDYYSIFTAMLRRLEKREDLDLIRGRHSLLLHSGSKK